MIFLLIYYYYHSMGFNFYQLIKLKKTRIVVFAKKNLVAKDKAKTKTYLSPALMPLQSKKIITIRIQLILNIIIISRKVIIPAIFPKKY